MESMCLVVLMFLLFITVLSLTAAERGQLGENFPFAINLLLDGKQLCSGILIDLEYTLSTCHCVGIFYLDGFIARDPSSIMLTGGHSVIGAENKKYSGTETRRCDEIIIHPKCSNKPWGWTFDYSVLRANIPFRPKLTLRPVVIPFTNPDTIGRLLEMSIHSRMHCIAVGWDTDFGVGRVLPVTRLKSVRVTLLYWEQCLKDLCSHGPNKICEKFNPEHRTKICAVDIGTQELCDLGDGGPVLCNGDAVGLLSKGLKCGPYNKPRIVIKFDFALEFISNIIR